MVGGFLGAGKTTAIAKLAAHYVEAGKTVALVTNDQAYDLVDTHSLRSQGFNVGEVPGACFCCNFDDLLETVDGLSKDKVPDIVIAEPVGSCTDLVATVIEPMKDLFGSKFELGPLVVLLKPEHGKKILCADDGKGFSPKAEYIFLKQLEEADAIVINKVDKLSEDDQKALEEAVAKKFPGIPSMFAGLRDGIGMEEFCNLFGLEPRKREQMMDVDYETYALGEAELGWFNCKIDASAAEKFSLDKLTVSLVDEIGDRVRSCGGEVAHLKVIGQTLQNTSVANCVSSEGGSELSLASEIDIDAAEVLVNARVAASPTELTDAVTAAASAVGKVMGMELKLSNVQSFRPEKPTPTHRAGQ